jgi:WhiB family redox-sensing transcriptional regulator
LPCWKSKPGSGCAVPHDAGPGLAQVSSAKAVCGRCPVRANCLSYALITRPDGIWGGTTREERWASLPQSERPEDRLSWGPA